MGIYCAPTMSLCDIVGYESKADRAIYSPKNIIQYRDGKMRDSIKYAIANTAQEMVDAEISVSFTKKELNSLGIIIPSIEVSSSQIRSIRARMNLSQSVFAKLLNVSASSIRQWEQGKRYPAGATKVLLELLEKSPHLLDYRLNT